MNRRYGKRPDIRQAEIHELLVARGEAGVDDLAKKFGASAETIRRDLSVLADKGQIRKIHGGARPIVLQGEGGLALRFRRNALAKRLIAEKLVQLVSPHQTIFMDTGSTTMICAEYLARIKHLTVITNSTHVADTFIKGAGGADVYLLGGQYSEDNAQTIGPTAITQIEQYCADQAIITVGAVDARGAMDFSNPEAQVAMAMMGASTEVTIVADHTKIGRSAAFRICGVDQMDKFVSDRVLEPSMHQTFVDADVEVH